MSLAVSTHRSPGEPPPCAPREGRALVDELQDVLARRTHRYFPEFTGTFIVEPTRGGRPMVRRHSVLFEFTVTHRPTGARRGIFVKIPNASKAEHIGQLYDTLRALYIFAHQFPDTMNVVRPLDCIPEHRALLTERVDGVTLCDALRRSPSARRHDVLLHQCGRFLRAYHDQLGQITSQRDFSKWFLQRCTVYLDRLATHGVDARVRDGLLARFTDAAVWLLGDVPIGLTFDDFSVRNILVREGRLFLVEASVPRRKPIYEDLASLLNSLTGLYWGTPWFFLGAAPSSALASSFLAGYFADSIPQPVLSLFCAKSLCFRWCEALDTWAATIRAAARTPPLTLVPRRINVLFHRQVMDHLDRAASESTPGLAS